MAAVEGTLAGMDRTDHMFFLIHKHVYSSESKLIAVLNLREEIFTSEVLITIFC